MRSSRLAALAAVVLAAMPVAMATAQTKLPTLRIGLAEDADALDPTLARTFVGRIVFAGLCDKLFDIDAKLGIVPQLATGYEWTDSRTLVMTLRPGVTFHDGTPMDAAAVKYSLERHLTMAGSRRRSEIDAIDHVEVAAPLSVRVVLKSANAPFLAQLTDRAGMIVSPKAAEAAGKDFERHPVCAGPFSFTERVAQDRIVLDRFPGYWNADAIKVGRVIYQPITDNAVRLANLQAGALDLAERFLPSDVEAIRKDAKLRLFVTPGLGTVYLEANIANGTRPRTPMMTDARVRKAFELALDRQAISQVVYNGLWTPVAQAVTPASPYYAADVPPPGRDVARAKALLAEAGLKPPVAVDLMTSNAPDVRQVGEVIQSMAGEAGFDVKLRAVEFVSALDASTNGDYEMFLIAWSGRVDPDGNLYSFFHSGAPLNDMRYADKEADGWLEAARATTDVAARKALYDKIAVRLERDLPEIQLYAPKWIVATTAKVSGFTPVPDGIIRLQGVTVAP
jgi:peptide/nickel transport system substrate-binding protein